jgi:hypothetical protein
LPGQSATVLTSVDIFDRSGTFRQMITVTVNNNAIPVEICGTVVRDVWTNNSFVRTTVDSGQTVATTFFDLHTIDHPDIEFDWTEIDETMILKEVSRKVLDGETIITFSLSVTVGDADKFSRNILVKAKKIKMIPFCLSFYCYRN